MTDPRPNDPTERLKAIGDVPYPQGDDDRPGVPALVVEVELGTARSILAAILMFVAYVVHIRFGLTQPATDAIYKWAWAPLMLGFVCGVIAVAAQKSKWLGRIMVYFAAFFTIVVIVIDLGYWARFHGG